MRRDDAEIWIMLFAVCAIAYGIIFYFLRIAPFTVPAPSLELVKSAPDYIPKEKLKALVDQNFPAALSSDELDRLKRARKPLLAKFVDYKSVDLNGDGRREDVVAAYSDGVQAMVAVFHRDGEVLSLVRHKSMPVELLGSFPSVRLQDVVGDGVPEVIVYLHSPHGELDTWVFRWDEDHLTSIGPGIVDGWPVTFVHEGVFLDITGDGRPELVDKAKLDRNNVPIYQTFRFDPEKDRYVPFKVLRNLSDVG